MDEETQLSGGWGACVCGGGGARRNGGGSSADRACHVCVCVCVGVGGLRADV